MNNTITMTKNNFIRELLASLIENHCGKNPAFEYCDTDPCLKVCDNQAFCDRALLLPEKANCDKPFFQIYTNVPFKYIFVDGKQLEYRMETLDDSILDLLVCRSDNSEAIFGAIFKFGDGDGYCSPFANKLSDMDHLILSPRPERTPEEIADHIRKRLYSHMNDAVEKNPRFALYLTSVEGRWGGMCNSLRRDLFKAHLTDEDGSVTAYGRDRGLVEQWRVNCDGTLYRSYHALAQNTRTSEFPILTIPVSHYFHAACILDGSEYPWWFYKTRFHLSKSKQARFYLAYFMKWARGELPSARFTDRFQTLYELLVEPVFPGAYPEQLT